MLTKKFCPKCGSDNIQPIAGGEIGMWVCMNCGFSGSIFPEKPILGGDIKEEKKIKKVGGKK